ncbi:MAG: helix-turn-helix domain-containing protein [Myxococcales bacterium]|nr:helix-turn-helix domain-containing protein [Myxococcales bacterium]
MAVQSRVTRRALERLRARRIELSLSQADVAEGAGVNASYVGLLERGERVPSLEVLASLCDALGLTMGELFAPASPRDGATTREGSAIAAILAGWPAEHRPAALKVIREMNALLRATQPRRRD